MNDVDAFLEHHGVKGQKWGIRKSFLDRISRVSRGTSITIQERHKKAAKRIAIGSAAIGASAVALIIHHNSQMKISELQKQVKVLESGRRAVNTFIVRSNQGLADRQAIARAIETKFQLEKPPISALARKLGR